MGELYSGARSKTDSLSITEAKEITTTDLQSNSINNTFESNTSDADTVDFDAIFNDSSNSTNYGTAPSESESINTNGNLTGNNSANYNSTSTNTSVDATNKKLEVQEERLDPNFNKASNSTTNTSQELQRLGGESTTSTKNNNTTTSGGEISTSASTGSSPNSGGASISGSSDISSSSSSTKMSTNSGDLDGTSTIETESSGKSQYYDDAIYDTTNMTLAPDGTLRVEGLDLSQLSEEDLKALIGSMSQEEYDQFIKGIEDYYQKQIDTFTDILEKTDANGNKGLNEQLKDVDAIINNINNLSNASTEYGAYQDPKTLAESTFKKQLETVGVSTYKELLALQAQLKGNVDYMNEAIKTMKNVRDSAKYDYMSYLDKYNEYEYHEYTKEELDSLEADSDYYNPADHPFLTALSSASQSEMGYTLETDPNAPSFSYTKYHEKHPDISPVEFIQMIETKYPGGYYKINGISNIEDLRALVEVADKVPGMAKTYSYLYEENPEKALQYLKDCKYEINNIKGQLEAKKFLDMLAEKDGNSDEALEAIANELGVHVEGLSDGVEGFFMGLYHTGEAGYTGVQELGKLLGLYDGEVYENRTMDVSEYKKMYILQALLSEADKENLGLVNPDGSLADPNSIIDFSKEYTGKFLSNNYEISQGIGNMLPSIALSMVNPALGSAAMGVSAGGNAYHGSMVEGHSYIQSLIYGAATGSSEAITERILGGLPGLSDTQVTGLMTWLKAMGKEGSQEMFQGAVDELIFRTMILGEELPKDQKGWEDFLKDLGKQGVYGAITAGYMQFPNMVRGTITVSKFNDYMKAHNVSQADQQAAIDAIRKSDPKLSQMTDEEIIVNFGMNVAAQVDLQRVQKTYSCSPEVAFAIMQNNLKGVDAVKLAALVSTGVSVDEALAQVTAPSTETSSTNLESGASSSTETNATDTDTNVDNSDAVLKDEAVAAGGNGDNPPPENIPSPELQEDAQVEKMDNSDKVEEIEQGEKLHDEAEEEIQHREVEDAEVEQDEQLSDDEKLAKYKEEGANDQEAEVMLKNNVTLEQAKLMIEYDLSVDNAKTISGFNLSADETETFILQMEEEGLTASDYLTKLRERTTFKHSENVSLLLEVDAIMTELGIEKLDSQSSDNKKIYDQIFRKLSSYEAKKAFYAEFVVSNTLGWAKGVNEYIAQTMYEEENPEKEFYALSQKERNAYMDSKMAEINDLSPERHEAYESDLESIRNAVAQKTIKRIEWLVDQGHVKPEFTAEDVLGYIMEDAPQEIYLSEQYVEEYRANWGTPDENGNVKVVCFQSADAGAPNSSTFGGSVGRDEGMFVMSYEFYESLLSNRKLFDEKGNCINTALLMKKLGGVKIGEKPVAIVQTVNINDIQMPSGQLEGAFIGDWVPGGYTSSGEYVTQSDGSVRLENGVVEGVIPPTNLFNDDGTLNENISLELLSDDAKAEFIRQAAAKKLDNAIWAINEYGITGEGMHALASAVAAAEAQSISLDPDVQSFLDLWTAKLNNPSLSNSQVLEIVAVVTDIRSRTSLSEAEAIKLAYIYAEGMNAAATKYNGFFKTFREHAQAHSLFVTEYALKVASGVDGLNVREVEYAAICHDLGMKGGLYAVEGDDGSITFLKIDEGYDLENLTEEESSKIANLARKNHPLNSAITIITEDILPADVDADVVALLAMSHSKSTSGIRHFSSQSEWLASITKLEGAIEQYNKFYGTDFKVDGDKLRELVNNPKEFARLQSEALAIRDGDAMSEIAFKKNGNYSEMIMQTGTTSNVTVTNPRRDYDDTVAKNFQQELRSMGVRDIITLPNGTKVALDSSNPNQVFSMKIHVGEQNVAFDSNYDGRSYIAMVTLVDPNNAPICTFDAIEERIGEVVTYDSCEDREFVIKLPKGAEGTTLGEWYLEKLESYKNQKLAKARENYSAKSSDLQAAQTALENAQSGKGDLSVAEAQAQVTAAQEAVDIANRELIFYSGDGANGTIRISFE